MRYRIGVLCVLLLPILSSCLPGERYHVLFAIKNNSAKSIYYTYSKAYPDTSVDNTLYIPSGSTRTPSEVIASGQKLDALIAPATLDNYFATIPSGKLEIFIYDVNVVEKTPWNTIVANNLVLKRYYLTIDDLKKTNGVIIYP